jgi:hypothetical protein
MRTCVGILLACAFCLTACNSGFSKVDVEKTEEDIRAQFEQKGFIVEQVNLVQDSDRHLSGYARVRKAGLILSRIDMTKNCSATMDETSGKFIWECK